MLRRYRAKLSLLIVGAALSGAAFGGGTPPAGTGQGPALRNACGPVAVYVACRWVGADCTLPQVMSAVGAGEGEPTTLGTLLGGLRRLGVAAELRRLSVSELRQALAHPDICGILVLDPPQSPGALLHVATVVREMRGHFLTIDFPNWAKEWSTQDLQAQWTGVCIIAAPSGSDLSRIGRSDRGSGNGSRLTGYAGRGLSLASILLGLGLLLHGPIGRAFRRLRGTRA